MAAAQNNANNSKDKPVVGRPFQKGLSGNPGGRPKGISSKVREILGGNDGEAIVRLLAMAMTGRLPDPNHPDDREKFIEVDVRERIMAAKLLMERGWGKPPQFAPMEDDDPLDMLERESDEIAAVFDARLDELGQRRAANAAKASAA